MRLRPILAEPPALSPSTRNSSHLPPSRSEQSASLPGSPRRTPPGLLRETCWLAAREAARARAEMITRATMLSAVLRLRCSHCSSAGRITPSTCEATSGLLRRFLVWLWNCGSST